MKLENEHPHFKRTVRKRKTIEMTFIKLFLMLMPQAFAASMACFKIHRRQTAE